MGTSGTGRASRPRRAAVLGVLGVLGVLVVLGADVPQASRADYHFSRPLSTNFAGVVIGGPPPAYRVLRREDVAWLREAACERAALAQGRWWTTNAPGRTDRPVFGHFPLSATNRFHRCTVAREWRGGHLETNVVLGWEWVTNAFREGAGADLAKPTRAGGVDVFAGLSFGSGAARYLAATNGLDGGARSVADAWPPDHTNVAETVVTNWGGASWEDGKLVFHVTQRVATVTMQMTNGTASVHTNVWTESLPWEARTVATNVTAGSALDLLFADGEARWDDAPAPAAMRPLAAYSYVTNCHGFLRRKKWLVDETANTNLLRAIVRRWEYNYTDDAWHMRPDTRTNETSAVGFFVDGVVISTTAEGYEAGSGRLVFPTRFDWDVVHTGGVCRIRAATLYAKVGATAYFRSGGSWTNRWGTYVAKVGTATKVGAPQGGKVCFEATVDGPAIARAGAAAVGAPVRSGWTAWGGEEAIYEVGFFLVYEMEPWASLPDW